MVTSLHEHQMLPLRVQPAQHTPSHLGPFQEVVLHHRREEWQAGGHLMFQQWMSVLRQVLDSKVQSQH